MAVPISNAVIFSYTANTSLTMKVDAKIGYTRWDTGDAIQVTTTPYNLGGTPITSNNTLPFPSADETLIFDFNISGLSDTAWNFNVMNLDGGANESFTNLPIPICFLAGTLIRTPDGDVPVESLKEGDSIISAGTLKDRSELVPYESPCEKKIKRIVNFKVTGDLPEISRPVKFKAGSLGDNLPEKDLCVSPWHGILIDGRLKNANLLFNGDEINFDFTCVLADYYHIELEEHSVIFANGVKTESFYDQAKDRIPIVASTPELTTD